MDPDEGVLNVLDQLLRYLAQRADLLVIHSRGRVPDRYRALRTNIPRFWPSREIAREIRDFEAALVLYVPSASVTAAALVRGALIERALRPIPVALFGLQRRRYGGAWPWVIRSVHPSRIIVGSRAAAQVLASAGVPCESVALGVDTRRFDTVTRERKLELRRELGLPADKPLFLHVGHLRATRGLERLADLPMELDIAGVMIASTATPEDRQVRDGLERAGIRVIREHLPNVADYFRASDVYVFPVRNDEAAIEFPLSVLEAMACNLPVVTTRFGALPEMFPDTQGLHFWNGESRLAELVRTALESTPATRKAVEERDWKSSFDDLFRIIEGGTLGR